MTNNPKNYGYKYKNTLFYNFFTRRMKCTTEGLKSCEINSNEGFQKKLNDLKERIDPENFLSEIGEFDNEGNFIIKDEIKGKDKNGDFIKVGGRKYYSAEARSRSNRGECLGYDIRKDNGVTRFFIGTMDGMLEKKGREYGSNGTFFDGTWLGNGEMDGYRVYSDGSSFRGKLDCLKPVSGTYRKVVNGEYQYTYEGDFKDGKYGGEGTMTWPDGDKYEGEWKNDKKEGQGTYTWSDGRKYEGERKNDKKEGQGVMKYHNGERYEGERKNGKQDGHGIYHYRDGHTDECEWVNGKPNKEGKIIQIRANGEKYVGDFLLDDNGVIRRFYELSDPNDKRSPTFFKIRRNKQISEGNNQALSNIKMEGIYTFPDGSHHEFRLTNGSITEKSNDFITMYGDKKPDEDRSEERGDIEYTIDYTSDSQIKYRIASRGKETTWELEGGVYKFKNKKGNILKIKKTSDFDDEEAMHAANLINSVRHFNAKAHNNRKFRYSGDELRATSISYTGSGSMAGFGCPSTAGTYSGSARAEEINGTVFIEVVPIHFGGISAKTLAERLNGLS